MFTQKPATLFKTLSALSLFLTVIFGLGYYVFSQVHKISQLLPVSSQDLPHKNPESKALFYHSIGRLSRDQDLSHQQVQEKSQYTLEIKTLDDQKEAEKTLNELEKIGLKAYYTPLQTHGKVVFKVRQGLYSDLTHVEQAKVVLKNEKHIDSQVIKL